MLNGVGKVYLHAVDTYGRYAFGILHVSKQLEAAVAVLHNNKLDLPVRATVAAGVVCGWLLWIGGRSFSPAKPCVWKRRRHS